jgi:hypothetical protein
VIDQLDFLIRATEAAQIELLSPIKLADHQKLIESLESAAQSVENRQNDSALQSPRQTPDGE